jgi:hypothetical protein
VDPSPNSGVASEFAARLTVAEAGGVLGTRMPLGRRQPLPPDVAALRTMGDRITPAGVVPTDRGWQLAVVGRLVEPVERGPFSDLKALLARAAPFLLITWFVVEDGSKVAYYLYYGIVGNDFFIYREAAVVALNGGDPWASSYLGYRFAAPPPTLLPYLILALLPQALAALVSVLVLGGAAIAVVRKLNLPVWWLLFPPIVDSLLAQNPDVLVIALLVAGGATAGLAPVFKLYAALPLLLQQRWRPLVIAGLISLASLPLVPAYLQHVSEMGALLASQAEGGLSAWGTPLLIPTAVALLLFDRKTASWLIVPALWPSTQLHYSSLALPALGSRWLLAAALAVPIPGLAPAAIAVTAVWERLLRDRISRTRPREDDTRVVTERDFPSG